MQAVITGKKQIMLFQAIIVGLQNFSITGIKITFEDNV